MSFAEAARRCGAGVAVLACLSFSVPVAAQTLPGAADSTRYVGPLLSPDHWATRALRRVDALGLVGEDFPAQRAVPLEMVFEGFGEARLAAGDASPVGALIADWEERLREEFGGATQTPDGGGSLRLLQRSISAGFRYRVGAAGPGIGEFEPHRFGAQPLADLRRPAAGADVSLGIGQRFGLSAQMDADTDGVRAERLELAARWGGARIGIGRVPIGYAEGMGGAVILTGTVPLDAVQVATDRPIHFPWVLRALGPVTIHGFLGRMTEARHPGDPFIWGASGQIRPHRRLRFGVHRAAFFGGEGEGKEVTLERVFQMLLGRVAGVGFEDQIVSVSGRFDLPTEQVIPLTAYLEWGAEDAAGAWFHVPGRVGGLWIPALPGIPEVTAGVEYAHFEPSCCDNPEWYRHWSFVGSWASRDRTLGHPLGGHGDQWMVHMGGDFFDSRLRARGRAFIRNRGAENLFSPERQGRSVGGDLDVSARLHSSWDIRLRSALDEGDDWRETHVEIQLSHFR